MTADQQQRIREMIQLWRDAGQAEHAEVFRAQMWAIVKPFVRGGA